MERQRCAPADSAGATDAPGDGAGERQHGTAARMGGAEGARRVEAVRAASLIPRVSDDEPNGSRCASPEEFSPSTSSARASTRLSRRPQPTRRLAMTTKVMAHYKTGGLRLTPRTFGADGARPSSPTTVENRLSPDSYAATRPRGQARFSSGSSRRGLSSPRRRLSRALANLALPADF